MDVPGMSLFQGSESIHIDNDNQRIEEEEAIQDQQRRNVELGNLIANAFDDLIDDDDGSSILSDDTNLARSRTSMCLLGGGDANVSDHSAHYKHCFRTSPASIETDQLHEKGGHVNAVVNGHSTEPLKALYDVRTREMQQLAEETDRWRRQVALKDAEKECLQMSLNQQVNQLGVATGRIEELTAEVATLKQNVHNAENSRSSVLRELESCRATISELQSRCDSLQRSRDVESRSDAILLSSEQRHQQETKVLMSRIDDLQNNLTLKTVQQERTLHKMAQMSRDHEALLLQRTETIVRLTADLEDTQRQADRLTADLEASQRHAKQLTVDLESTERKTSHHNSKRRTDVGELNELNGKLKAELERCVGGLRAKTEETRKLQEMIDMKEKVIKNLLEQEACCATQVSKFREETEQLYKECKDKEIHATELRKQNERLRETNDSLKRDIAKLELQATKKKLVFSAQAEAGTSPRSDDGQEVDDLRNRLEQALTENENVKKLYVEICETKDQTIAELTKLREEYNRLWSRDENGQMKKVGNNQAPNTSIIDDQENLELEEGNWQSQIDQLKSHYQSKLDEEIAKQAQQFREAEELIKQEAIKLFSDDIEALETRRDDAVYDLEQCQAKLSLCEKQLRDLKSIAETKFQSKDKELERLRKECDEKVNLLKEAERRFEIFEANTCDEFEKLSNEQQKTIEKLVVKYKALKKMTKDLKMKASKETGMNSYRSQMESYRASLTEINKRMTDLIESGSVVKEIKSVSS